MSFYLQEYTKIDVGPLVELTTLPRASYNNWKDQRVAEGAKDMEGGIKKDSALVVAGIDAPALTCFNRMHAIGQLVCQRRVVKCSGKRLFHLPTR